MTTCESEFDPQALTVEEAQERIDAAVVPVHGTERLAIRDCLGRILSQDILASRDIPAASNSAMDGYALRAGDLDPARPTSIQVIGESFAGKPYQGQIEKGQ